MGRKGTRIAGSFSLSVSCNTFASNSKIRATTNPRRYDGPVREFFYLLPRNFIGTFRGRNLWWHASAIVLTIAIVTSGGDWAYYQWTRSERIFVLARSALGLGMLIPIVGPLALLIASVATTNRRLRITPWALGQAALLAYLVTSCYKAVTGRRPPPFSGHFRTAVPNGPLPIDSSHGFQFGFLKGGIFWGWPSGHTTVAFSMALCLITLYPKNRIIALCALLYAFYVGLAVSVTIHWFSEFAAGAIIGSVIGMTVGRSFRTTLPGQNDNSPVISRASQLWLGICNGDSPETRRDDEVPFRPAD
jgi:membrane-associated phospholipid phosphatase